MIQISWNFLSNRENEWNFHVAIIIISISRLWITGNSLNVIKLFRFSSTANFNLPLHLSFTFHGKKLFMLMSWEVHECFAFFISYFLHMWSRKRLQKVWKSYQITPKWQQNNFEAFANMNQRHMCKGGRVERWKTSEAIKVSHFSVECYLPCFRISAPAKA